jgi:glyoxylase-like metal-dependent hydrolase (beta-lactamase superfamily II)
MDGWHDLGGLAVRTLIVSRFRLDGGSMFGQVPKPLWSRYSKADGENRIPLVVRALLVRGASRLLLVDAGMGHAYPPDERARLAIEPCADLPELLAAAGVEAAAVTDVLLTHLHFDHVGGLGLAGDGGALKPALPGARVHLHRAQWLRAQAPGPKEKRSFREIDLALLRRLEPDLVEQGQEIIPGVTVQPTEGHTEGLLVVTARGARGEVVYPSDLIPTLAHVRLPYTTGFDMWPDRLMAEKQQILERAAEAASVIVLNHDPATAACRVRRGRDGFAIHSKIDL